MFQKLFRREGSASLVKAHTFVERTLNVPLSKLDDYGSYLEAGTKKVWASFRACHLTACTVLGATLRVMEKAKNGEVTRVEEGSPLHVLLNNPNPYDSFEELLYLWVFHMKLTGNAYWHKDEVNGKGQPLHLYPLLPQYVRVVPDSKKKIGAFHYRINGREIEYTPEEIIHFRRPHPNNLCLGIGDVEPAEPLFNDYINRNTLEEQFIRNGATPSGIMTREDAEEMDQTEFSLLKNKWRDEYGGTKNAGKVMFLSGKWRYEKLGLTQTEMQSLERTRMTVEEIFMMHGVPLSIAGVQGAANYATAKQDDINFRKFEVVPLINLLVGKLNASNQLATTFNENWFIDYQLSGLVDVEQVWKDYNGLLMQGCMTPNELREQMGLMKSDDPMMDLYYVNNGRVPLETVVAGGAPGDPQAGKTPALDFMEMAASITEAGNAST